MIYRDPRFLADRADIHRLERFRRIDAFDVWPGKKVTRWDRDWHRGEFARRKGITYSVARFELSLRTGAIVIPDATIISTGLANGDATAETRRAAPRWFIANSFYRFARTDLGSRRK